MVEVLDAAFALATVLGAHWPDGLAAVTQVVDGVVHVTVVSPRRGVANLKGER